MGCSPVGGLPTFDPFQQQAVFPGAMPYGQPQMMPYPQQAYPQASRPVPSQPQTQPRPQAAAPKPSPPKPAPVATRPQPERGEVLPVLVPSPQQLGIRLDDAAIPQVVVPEPEKLGIRVE